MPSVIPATAADVPDALAPPPRHRRFPLIDGLRAIAVMSVLLVHVSFFDAPNRTSLPGRLMAHLNIGVTIFFLISGFLLYRPFIAAKLGGPEAPAVASYFKRRTLRIIPAYWLALTVLTALPGLTGVYQGHWISQYLLTDNLPIGGSAACTSSISACDLAQTWSLGVEVSFYLVLPLYALGIGWLLRRAGLRSWMLAQLGLLATAAAASVLLRFHPTLPTVGSWVGGTVLGFGYWFALGMGLAVVSVRYSRSGRRPAALRLIARRPLLPWALALAAYVGLCLYLPGSAFIFDRDKQIAEHLGFGVVALLLMLPAVFGDEDGGLPRRFLANAVVGWLGLISYGIFLWHFAFAVKLSEIDGLGFLGTLAGTLAGSIAVAAASYYLLERPILRFKYRRIGGTRVQVARRRRA